MAQPADVHPERAPLELDHDHITIFRSATWADFQRMLEMRGERSAPRFTFLEGVPEILTPSRAHELTKSMIGCLVDAWCMEKGIEITPYGSWTLESKQTDRAVEPDECYVLGDVAGPADPISPST